MKKTKFHMKIIIGIFIFLNILETRRKTLSRARQNDGKSIRLLAKNFLSPGIKRWAIFFYFS